MLDYIVAGTPVVDGRTNRVFVFGQSPIDVRTGEALGPGALTGAQLLLIRVLAMAAASISRGLIARKGVAVRAVSVMRPRARHVPASATLCALLLVMALSLRLAAGHGPLSAVVYVAPNIVALDARTRRVFIAVNDLIRGLVAVADERTGLVQRTLDTGADQTIAGIDIDEQRGHVLVTVAPTDTPGVSSHTRAGMVLTLDARTGAVLRRARVGPDPQPTTLDAQRGRLLVFSNDAVSTGRVTTIDTTSGRALRTVTLGTVDATSDLSGVAGSALDETRGRLFAVTRHDVAYSAVVLDTATGALVRTVGLGVHPEVAGVNVIADAPADRALVGLAGRVFVLDARDGRLVHAVTLGLSTLTMVGDPRTGRVFAADVGRVRVLDVRTGRVVHTTPVPATIGTYDLVAVAATGRVLLLTPAEDARGAGEVDSLSVLDAATGALLRTTSLGTVGDGRSGYDIAQPANALQVQDRAGQRAAPSGHSRQRQHEEHHEHGLQRGKQAHQQVHTARASLAAAPQGQQHQRGEYDDVVAREALHAGAGERREDHHEAI